jgi:hypothetical protein
MCRAGTSGSDDEHPGQIQASAGGARAPGQGYLMDRYTDPPFGTSAITTFGPQFDPSLRYLASSYEVADSRDG